MPKMCKRVFNPPRQAANLDENTTFLGSYKKV